MADIKFGFGQIANATPAIIGRIKRGLNFFSGGVVIFLPAIAQQLGTTTDTLATWMGFFILTFNSIATMFGVQLGESQPVDSSKVTEVETPVITGLINEPPKV